VKFDSERKSAIKGKISRGIANRIRYSETMTKQGLEILLEHVAAWPQEAQEELVQSLADIEQRHLGIYRLSEEERTAVRRGLREMRDGKIASDEEVAAVFARYRA
jgi:hypothetical protein